MFSIYRFGLVAKKNKQPPNHINQVTKSFWMVWTKIETASWKCSHPLILSVARRTPPSRFPGDPQESPRGLLEVPKLLFDNRCPSQINHTLLLSFRQGFLDSRQGPMVTSDNIAYRRLRDHCGRWIPLENNRDGRAPQSPRS